MPPDPMKRLLRELKRAVKKRGNKVRRAQLKRSLADAPETAAEVTPTVGRHSSAAMNGQDRDSTRKPSGPGELS